ncbi:hypothetical protein VEx25_A1211 [Vibrio antiquarius]|uniref:Uncharacterized protein n=1 Tax=Vibrio antiquarius (strain Ex25) TaxID=150340 RepID=A0ABM9WW55_VIBAE|nr:hypothetical protein VEx25_A1211 [Vibrio antiquarius]
MHNVRVTPLFLLSCLFSYRFIAVITLEHPILISTTLF